MKKYVLVVVLFILSSPAFSQVKIGITGGLNIANISADYGDAQFKPDYSSNIGLTVGLTAELPLSEKISLQPGLMYSMKGGTDEGDGFEDKYTYNYAELPLNLAFNINDQFQLFAGPYVGVALGGKNEYSEEPDYSEENTMTPFMGEISQEDYLNLESGEFPFNGLDYGLNFGAAYQAGPVRLRLGYGLGLANIIPKIEGGNNADDFSEAHRVVQLTATYFFGQ